MEVSVNADTFVPLTERIYDSLRKEVFMLPFPLNGSLRATKSERAVHVLEKMTEDHSKLCLFANVTDREVQNPFDWGYYGAN
jgi:hypothetical protein